ncbi:hypothetical protein [Maritimibacter sp. 55A14]|uniref:cytochrome P460 family protein n=1 Tax=Maritimibacter sp. 55A14 TaxID=2174844 RepID=UPI001E58F550|nr:hypothetical protein [Maritimibacter sp. 55A14]
MTAAALSAASTLHAQSAGTEADIADAQSVWNAMTEAGLAGPGAIMTLPYDGTEPHGMQLETFFSEATADGHSGLLVVKRNYGPEGVSAEDVLADPDAHLAAITVMFQREDGYDPDNNNWFYAKYLPDGSLDENPAGMALAGAVGHDMSGGCIACHVGADGDDYLFTTDAFGSE